MFKNTHKLANRSRHPNKTACSYRRPRFCISLQSDIFALFGVFLVAPTCISICVLRHETHIHIFCWHVVTFCAFADLYRKTQVKRANSESGCACLCVRSCRSDVHFDTYFAAQNACAQLLRIIRWFFAFVNLHRKTRFKLSICNIECQHLSKFLADKMRVSTRV